MRPTELESVRLTTELVRVSAMWLQFHFTLENLGTETRVVRH
jgi:hypothetical protein